jgi:hypothetical protein
MNLIEISLSVGIVAFLACLGTASFVSVRELQHTAMVSQSLQQSLYFGREQAVLRYQNIIVTPKNDLWEDGWNIQLDSNPRSLISYDLQPMKIIYVPFQKSVKYIKIFSDGTTNGYQGHFEFGTKKFIINRGGRGRVESM